MSVCGLHTLHVYISWVIALMRVELIIITLALSSQSINAVNQRTDISLICDGFEESESQNLVTA